MMMCIIMKTNHINDFSLGRKIMNGSHIPLLMTLGLLIIFASRCKKDSFNMNFELLTSTVWIRTQQCGSSVEDASNFTIFKPDGEWSGEFYGFFSLTWSLKSNGKTLVIDQTEYVIEELTSTTLKITAPLGCPMSFIAASSVKVTADGVSSLTQTAANLHGSIATHASLVVSFEYGVSTSYGGTVTPVNSSVPDISYALVECALSGLLPETTYHYRIKAVNSSGTFYSKDLTFRTFNVQSISDLDGNIYNTVTIGTQIWMAENLKTTKYRNGDPIPNVTDPTQWSNLTTGAYCNNDNDINYANTYGHLYNWYAISDSRNIAPTGWHVASDADWTKLTSATWVEGTYGVGSKIKEYGTSHWVSPNIGATNEAGFTALPCGGRGYDGTFGVIGTSSGWWSSTYDTDNVSSWVLPFFNGNASSLTAQKKYVGNLLGGNSVRCIKDN
jgi:uncharacterized protein (TIGR02145 family)